MTQPTDDLDRRRPVWEALSALFLDTEIDDAWRAQVVRTLDASGYSAAELDWVLWNEVCPVLHLNLLAPTGEWSGFDMDEVERCILNSRPTWLRQAVSGFLGGRLVRAEWAQIQHDLTARRAS